MPDLISQRLRTFIDLQQQTIYLVRLEDVARIAMSAHRSTPAAL